MNQSYLDPAANLEGVENAVQTVTNCLDSTRANADIFHKLTQNESLTVSGLGDRYYTQGVDEFILKRRIPIPPELVQQMNNMRARFCMGLFSEIGRAWVTIDRDIFMWNYENNDDLAYFDGIANTVVKIALAKPKPGVFQSHVQYLLVVGTTIDVVIMALSIGSDGELSLIPEELFKVDLENALLNDIVCTNEGRIFFTANDVLYELEYQDKSWFQRSCKKVNRSTSYLQTFIPFFSQVAEDIEQVVVDESRHILFALTKKHSIQVFDLGSDGATCSKVTTMTIGQITHEANQLTSGQHEPSFFSNLVNIAVVPAHHSHHINLVATTTKGVRLFISCQPRSFHRAPPTGGHYLTQHLPTVSQQDARPQCLRVVHVRFSPGVCPSSIYKDAPQGVYAAHVQNNTCVMATTGRDVVFALSDLHLPNSQAFTETMSELHISGHVWAASASSRELLCARNESPSAGHLLPSVRVHPFYRQHAMSEQEVMLFTSNGLFVFTHRSPLSQMRDALTDTGAHDAAGPEVVRMWQALGATDTLVLAMHIMSSEQPVDEPIREKAARLVFAWKDEPEMVDGDSMSAARRLEWNSPQGGVGDSSIADWATRMRSPLIASTPHGDHPSSGAAGAPFSSPFSPSDASFVHANHYYNFKPSARHNALYSYFSRLVEPLWDQPVCVIAGGKLALRVPEDDLEWLSCQLRALGRAMDDYGLVPRTSATRSASQTGTIANKFGAEAASRERTSLQALRRLVSVCAETLSLWATAARQGLHALSASIDPHVLPSFAGRLFHDLIGENCTLNQDLIKVLIKYFLGDAAGTKDLSDRLREVCPTLYSKDDALVTNAMEMLERASTLDAYEARRRVDEACRLLAQSIHKLSLPAVCTKLMQLKAYEQVVSLCLARAAKDDAKQLALIAFKNTGMTDGDREAAAAMQRRSESYRVITQALDQLDSEANGVAATQQSVSRDAMLKCVLCSEDELAHAAMFRWLMGKGRQEQILKWQSPYVEDYLRSEIQRGGGDGTLKYLDLLWKLYEKSGAFDKAAKLLAKLADSEMTELRLSHRYTYLSHAIICAQSASEPAVKASLQDMRDRLEVATIQKTTKDALVSLATEDARKSAAELDKQLVTLQDLLVYYAKPFELARVQLAIYHCANFYDQNTIHKTWDAIIAGECVGTNKEALTQALLSTLSDLSALYAPSNYFPTEYIVVSLLSRAFDHHLPVDFFVRLLQRIRLSLSEFLNILSTEYRSGDPFWRENAAARQYVMEVGCRVVESFLDEPHIYKGTRSAVAVECDAAMSLFTLEVRSVGNTAHHLAPRLAIIKQRLANI